MKKSLKSIFSLILVVLLLASPVYASGSDDTMQADWRGDYTNMNLIIKVKSPVPYIQNVTVTMYPKGATPGFDTYCRVDEVTFSGREEKEIIIKLANDLNAPNGEYTVVLQGNGAYDSEKNRAEIDVCVLSPNSVGSLLNQINSVTGDTDESLANLKTYMQQAAAALRIDGVDAATNSQLKTVINVRNIDFATNGSKFLSLNDVENAWRATGLIEYLNQENINGTQLETEYKAVAGIMSIDMTDDDYAKVKTSLYNNIISMRTAFNNNNGVQTLKDAEKIFNQAKAVAVVNSSSVDDMEDAIVKYKATLEISDTTYNTFARHSSDNREKIMRQLVNKNFQTASAVKEAFSTAVSGAGEPGGGNGGGGGGGGSSDDDDDYPTENPGSLGGNPDSIPAVPSDTPSSNGVFSDVNGNHWAANYISVLEKEGIVSGYADGRFYPSNTVKREEFVKMVVLASGMYTAGQNCNYDDVREEEWYFTYIASASQSGIVNGIGNGVFGIGNNITREDVSVIVNRILLSKNVTPANPGFLKFTDNAQISDYAKESIKNLSALGILSGFEDGSFKPKANLTRAEAAKIIFMLKDHISR